MGNFYLKLGKTFILLLLGLGFSIEVSWSQEQIITKATISEVAPATKRAYPKISAAIRQTRIRDQQATHSVSADAEVEAKICPRDLGTEIEAIINRPEWKRSRWGILIQSQTGSRVLYALNAQNYFIPASNVKLLTTAAALRYLGADFRIRTSVSATGTIPNLTTLRLVGKGDPTLTTSKLQDLAKQLKNQGVQRIEKLIIEDSYFESPAILPSWEWEDVNFYYGTAVNSLILNENAVTLTLLPQQVGQPVELNWSDDLAGKQWLVENEAVTATPGTSYAIEINGVLGKPVLQIQGELAADSEPDPWGLAILDPANYFLETWYTILETEGIIVEEKLITTTPELSNSAWEIEEISSPTLAELIQQTNQPSNNLYADALLKTLGANSGTNSLVTLQQILTRLGVDPESYNLSDGSGLSRHNLVSPEAVVQTLRLMSKTKDGVIYRESLPVAGVNGTLKRRFLDTVLVGNLQAKTGTMTGVSALSGYLDVSDYRSLVFSIIVNQSEQSVATQRQAIDEIVLLLSKLGSC
ncbi:MAG: D-alanyl-D-alanine carboxypeptidase/D-alanyl-D-alanine-endopeptidase [Oscillatoria sp. PMC 1068.18]|nr:D-alanyl-D-alanine carboxypeptidase/D-alanyl-D-alanine-endopeptidase [Oscillatoria sp. PMC 1076.18]MEC4987793.1 D-alanyl-D-alanine carboxypeptidase/D-alanyl-D-alanine-endopeptidase [Oscillatoria sp. PMC 1068.18]